MTVVGDARRLPFADGAAQCVVTSPPYYGLRDYGIGGQIGLEQTPAAYVAELVAVFREVWRVLRDDGVAWLNLGDSYGTGTKAGRTAGNRGIGANTQAAQDALARVGGPEKNLLGIPWRVAFALQSDGAASPETMRAVQRMIRAITDSYETRDQWPDKIAAEVERLEREYVDANAGGWYLRSDCIWHKPNPMPESVTDRPTKAHEYVFLLSKAARYYYDAAAVAEVANPAYQERYKYQFNVGTKEANGAGRPGGYANTPGIKEFDGTRNARTVWTIATRPYSGAHFATMPPALAQKCILAGSRPGDVVLDPFSGAGTTERVAIENGRRFIGTELNPKYIALRSERVAEVPVRML